MSRDCRPGTGGLSGAAPRGLGLRGSWRRARLGRPATLRWPRAARSAAKGPPAPVPPSARQGYGRPFDPKRVPRPPPPRPAEGPRPPTPVPGSPRPPLPREDGRTRRTAASASPPQRAEQAEGRPGTRAPGGHRADPRAAPRPRTPPAVQAAEAAAVSSLLTSSPRGPRCHPKHKSVPLTRRGEGRGSRSPAHHPRPPAACPSASPPVPEPARDSPSRAAVLRSNQAALPPRGPPLLSTSFAPSLAPSLPPISSSPSAASPAPNRSCVTAHRWVGQNVCQSQERGHTSSPPLTASPAPAGNEKRRAGKKMEEYGVTGRTANQ